MKSNNINSIEQKLKEGAKTFRVEPRSIVHENIMKNVASRPPEISVPLIKSQKPSWHWFLPAGLTAVIAMSVFIFVNNDVQDLPKAASNNSHLSSELLSMTKVVEQMDVNVLSLALETELTTKMESEKKALMKDFYYLKTFFAIDVVE